LTSPSSTHHFRKGFRFGDGPALAKGIFDVKGAVIPVAVSAFPDEIYTTPRSWAEKAYPKLIYPKGGHFAAWEQRQLVRTGLRSLRQAT
jgi:hypothetical protein